MTATDWGKLQGGTRVVSRVRVDGNAVDAELHLVDGSVIVTTDNGCGVVGVVDVAELIAVDLSGDMLSL